MGRADRRRPRASGPPLSRVERRRQAQARRNRLILVLGVVASLAVVAAWFPASDLLQQRRQLDATMSQLHQLNAQNRSLRHQAKELETPAAVGRIAQQQYDLVQPGVQAYQVLPPSSSGGNGTLTATAATTSGAGTSAGTTAHAGTSGAGSSSDSRRTTGATAPSTGFLGRVVQTLEFWR